MYKNTDRVVIAGNLNATTGNQAVENVIGLLGESSINVNRIRLREFANPNKLKGMHNFLRKRTLTNMFG